MEGSVSNWDHAKIADKIILSSRFLQKLTEETAEGFAISSLPCQHLLHQAEGKSAPCGYQRRCTCASSFAYFLPWVYRKDKNPAKPLPHKICWPWELLYIAGDAPSQLQVQKSLPCFQLLHKRGWTHRRDSLSLQDNLHSISGRLL